MAKLTLTFEVIDKNLNINSNTDFDPETENPTEQEKFVMEMAEFIYRGVQTALQYKLQETPEEN